MKKAARYTLKVWSTTVCLSALISMIIQSCILLPNYHLQKGLNPYFDWLLQLVGTSLVNAILLLPMAIGLLIVAKSYVKRNMSLKTILYVVVIALCISPSLALLCYELKNGDIKLTSVGGVGMMLNILTYTLITVASIWYYELKKDEDEFHSLNTVM